MLMKEDQDMYRRQLSWGVFVLMIPFQLYFTKSQVLNSVRMTFDYDLYKNASGRRGYMQILQI